MTSSSNPPAAHLLQISSALGANNSASSPSSSSSSSSTSSRSPRAGAGAGAQNQACAACKYQRRKCNADCPLARYFPADQQRRFLNAHRLFGVSNIQKTLRDTEPELRQDAMRALIFQSEARAYDPVGGACRVILELEKQYDAGRAELVAVLTHLDLCRQQAAAIADVDPGMYLAGGAVADQDDVVVDSLYSDKKDTGQASGLTDQLNQMQPAQHQQQLYFYYDGSAGDIDTANHAWSNIRQYGNGAAAVVKAGSPVALREQLEQHYHIETQFVDVFDTKPDMKPETTITMEHAGSGSFEHLEEIKVPAVVKNELGHQAAPQMAQSSAATRCQLELGFSSSNAW